MKKSITIGLAAMLAVGSFSPAVLAADKNKKGEDERIVERVTVDTLTLEDAIRYGLNSDYSLMEIDYNIENLKITEDKLDDSYDNAESSLDSALAQRDALQKQLEQTSSDTVTIDLEQEIDELITSLRGLNVPVEELEPGSGGTQADYLIEFLESIKQYTTEYEKYQQNQLIKEKLNLVNAQISTLQSAVTSLENSLDDIDLNQTTLFNNRIQAREGIKLSIISSYIGIIMSQQQLDFMKNTLLIQQAQANSIKTRYELGLLPEKEYVKATRDLTELEEDITQLETDIKNKKSAFALSIGIAYTNDYNLVEPELGEMTLVKQEKSMEELIKNSYNMVNARTQLRLAEDALDEVDDKEDRVKEDKKLAEINVEIAKLKMESTEVDLEKAITNLYAQLETQYQALKDAEDELAYAKEDIGDLQLYYDLGLVSKQEYESSSASVEQAQLNYNNAKYQYYLLTQQVKALDEGVIITN